MRVLFMSLVVMLALLCAGAVENQAYLGIFAETNVNRIAGMPDMSALMPPGMVIPNMPNMPGMPQRKLTVRLWSPSIAAKNAVATLAIPTGLKLGEKLNLDLYRPEGQQSTGGKGDPGAIPDFTIYRYWGSSATVKDGQPEVIKFAALSADEKAAMRTQAQKASGSYFYKEGWTTGYWPTDKQPGKIDADAALTGGYALTTNYTGNVDIDVPETIKFLDPIQFSSPKLTAKVDLTKAMVFKWKAVPGVLGYHAIISGMKGKNTLITWSSSEVKESSMIDWDYMQMSDVRRLVKDTVMMEPTRTEVTAPAGIFKDCDSVLLLMIGYGPGVALDQVQPIPRMQTKTVVSVMLGGKMAATMAGPETDVN